MIGVRARKNSAGDITLYLRICNSDRDNAIAMGVTISQDRWKVINSNLKILAKANGSMIVIEDQLTSDLWSIINELKAQELAGVITDKSIKLCIDSTLRKKQMDEINRLVATHKSNKNIYFSQFIDRYIADIKSGERKKKKSFKKVSASTVTGYIAFKKVFDAYQEERKCSIELDEVTIQFYHDFVNWMENNYSVNYIGLCVRQIKTIMKYADDLHLITCRDYRSSEFAAITEEVDNVYLTKEMLQQLWDIDFDDVPELKKRIDKLDWSNHEKLFNLLESSRRSLSSAKDLFLLGCYTGQRVSDYMRIDNSMIEKLKDGNLYLKINQIKTGKEVYVPLTEKIKTILQRNGGKMPKMYVYHLNKCMKKIGEIMGWNSETELPGKKFYECLSSHTARRTFATLAYQANVPLSAIMAFTGHAKEETLRKYLKLTSKEKAMDAAVFFAKLSE